MESKRRGRLKRKRIKEREGEGLERTTRERERD